MLHGDIEIVFLAPSRIKLRISPTVFSDDEPTGATTGLLSDFSNEHHRSSLPSHSCTWSFHYLL